jgi:transglutaminase-like putative cysteine protease
MARPAKISSTGRISLPVAIERYFQVALFLLVLTGFGTLASTGTLDLATVVLVGGALLVRGYLLSNRIEAQIPALWTTYLTLAYALFYFLDYTLLSRSFLTATVHLVLFGMVVRLFSVQKERDHIMLAVLSFLMVLSGAVLTVDSVFLFAFAGFLLMAVAAFVLMEMRRSSKAATVAVREPVDAGAYRKMAFALAGAAPILVALILVGAFGIFFLLPRTSAGYLSGFASGNDLSTGFSERVQLGRIGQIQQSSAVVMHVQIDGDANGLYDFKWRGVALGKFDGKTWSGSTEQFPLPRLADGRFALSRAAPEPGRGARLIHYRVLMEPIGTNVFFLAGGPKFLSGSYRMIARDDAGAVFNLDESHAISVYEADSDPAAPTAEMLRTASSSYPPDVLNSYLGLPPRLDPRIPDLARQVAEKASTNYDKAEAISQYLNRTYKYTLQLPQSEPQDPLANFLFERKEGHCEYFASSMAVMLRVIRIPSRVVNGFRTTEFNDLTSTYVIRASSAHSWVEAYFPEYGWVTFDPTPAAALSERQGWSRMALYLDAMASFWREWIVNYDASHQRALGQDAMRGSRAAVERMRSWAQERYARLLESARRTQARMGRSPGRWSALGIAAAALLLLLANVSALRAWLRRRRLRAHPERAPRQAAALWYSRMTLRLAKEGWRKQPVQTPQEFVTSIDEKDLRAKVAEFTGAYEAARFGESAEAARRLPELYEEIAAGDRR